MVSFKKGFNKDISPATISWIKLWSYAKSSVIKRPLFYIRLEPMMSGPLLPRRHSSQELPSQQLLSACLKSVLLEGCGLGWFRAEPPSLVSYGGCPADLPLVHTQISSLSPYQRVFKLAVACSRLSSHLLLPKRASPGTKLKPLFPHLRGGLLNKGGGEQDRLDPVPSSPATNQWDQLMSLKTYQCSFEFNFKSLISYPPSKWWLV